MAEPRREIGPHFVSCGVRGHHFYRVDDWSPQEGEAFSTILGPSALRNASTQIYSGPRRDPGANPASSSAKSVANLAFGAHSIEEPKVGIQPTRSYCARGRGGGTWMRWSFPSPASACTCGVPSITKARSSTYRRTTTA